MKRHKTLLSTAELETTAETKTSHCRITQVTKGVFTDVILPYLTINEVLWIVSRLNRQFHTWSIEPNHYWTSNACLSTKGLTNSAVDEFVLSIPKLTGFQSAQSLVFLDDRYYNNNHHIIANKILKSHRVIKHIRFECNVPIVRPLNDFTAFIPCIPCADNDHYLESYTIIGSGRIAKAEYKTLQSRYEINLMCKHCDEWLRIYHLVRNTTLSSPSAGWDQTLDGHCEPDEKDEQWCYECDTLQHCGVPLKRCCKRCENKLCGKCAPLHSRKEDIFECTRCNETGHRKHYTTCRSKLTPRTPRCNKIICDKCPEYNDRARIDDAVIDNDEGTVVQRCGNCRLRIEHYLCSDCCKSNMARTLFWRKSKIMDQPDNTVYCCRRCAVEGMCESIEEIEPLSDVTEEEEDEDEDDQDD